MTLKTVKGTEKSTFSVQKSYFSDVCKTSFRCSARDALLGRELWRQLARDCIPWKGRCALSQKRLKTNYLDLTYIGWVTPVGGCSSSVNVRLLSNRFDSIQSSICRLNSKLKCPFQSPVSPENISINDRNHSLIKGKIDLMAWQYPCA